MGKLNITIGKIVLWVAAVLMLFSVFGTWYGFDIMGIEGDFSLQCMWDMGEEIDFGAGFILGVFSIILLVATTVLVTLDFVNVKSKILNYVTLGTGALAVLTFIIGAASKPDFDGLELDMGYGLIMLIFAGILIAASPFVDDLINGNIKIPVSVGTSAPNGNGGQAKKFCPQCGAEVANDAPFCGSCGHKMN